MTNCFGGNSAWNIRFDNITRLSHKKTMMYREEKFHAQFTRATIYDDSLWHRVPCESYLCIDMLCPIYYMTRWSWSFNRKTYFWNIHDKIIHLMRGIKNFSFYADERTTFPRSYVFQRGRSTEIYIYKVRLWGTYIIIIIDPHNGI